MRRVVVTALGALTPIGNSLPDFWEGLKTGKNGVGKITKFDTEKFKTKFAFELKGFNNRDHFNGKEIKIYDPFTQYALVAVQEALNDGKIDFDTLNKRRCGVIWGSGNGGVSTSDQQVKEFSQGDGTPRFSPFFMPRILVDMPAGIISIKYGLRGVNFCPVSACATSTTSIIEAFNHIRWNKADLIITGGSEAPITESTIGGFGAAKALSTQNDNMENACRPFDKKRDGFVMGEGAGAIVLEAYEHAKARGAKIYAEVVGGGMAADAYHLTGTHPEGEGAVFGMEEALKEAQISPDQVDYINMHATSTPLGDVSELKAALSLFGKRKSLSISATKSMTGHLLGAAGAVESIACILALKHSIVPPTINTDEMEEDYSESFDFPLKIAKQKEMRYALNNTFGFGGHIASVLFKKWENK